MAGGNSAPLVTPPSPAATERVAAPPESPEAPPPGPALAEAPSREAVRATAAATPPEATAGPGIPASGGELREERQKRRQTLEGIAEKTKIRRTYLQAIEEERFGDLPAAVFVRGFIREYARSLGLPGDEVVRQYMKRHRDWQESRPRPPGGPDPYSRN